MTKIHLTFFSTSAYREIEQLYLILNHVVKVKLNETTGFHVHYGVNPQSKFEAFQILCFQLVKYEEIFQRLVPPHRRDSPYVRSLTNNATFKGLPLSEIKKLIQETKTIDQLVKLMNPGDFDPNSMNQARYCWVNLTNLLLQRIDTIEFRIFPGSNDFQTICNWVKIGYLFLEKGLQMKEMMEWPENLSLQEKEQEFLDDYIYPNSALIQFCRETWINA